MSCFGFGFSTFFGSSGGLAAVQLQVPSLLLIWLKSSSSSEEDGSEYRLMAVVQDTSAGEAFSRDRKSAKHSLELIYENAPGRQISYQRLTVQQSWARLAKSKAQREVLVSLMR